MWLSGHEPRPLKRRGLSLALRDGLRIRDHWPHDGGPGSDTYCRGVVGMVMAGGIVLGALVGWSLALGLEQPLRSVAQGALQLAGGRVQAPIPERGPEEVTLLVHAFNILV